MLLCEDHPGLGAFTALALRAAGHEVALAATAELALERLLARPFSVLVTDFDLPGRDGSWLLRRCTELRPAVRRVLTTGRGDVDVDALLRQGLAHAFLPKPFGIPQLQATLEVPPTPSGAFPEPCAV